MKKYNTSISVCCVIIILLLMGCSSDTYSIRDVCDYAKNNKDELVDISNVVLKYLSTDHNRIFMDENGEIKLSTEVYREYIAIEDIKNIDTNDIDTLQKFFMTTNIDSISLMHEKDVNGDENIYGDMKADNENSYISMHIPGDTHGTTNYYLTIINVDDISFFDNPLEGYDKGGFKKTVGSDNNSVSWVSDHRTDILSDESHFMYKADIVKATDGVWVSRQEINIPAYDYFIND